MSVQESIKNGQYSFKDLLKTIKFDLKQNILSCELAPSLQALSLISVAINLWQCDIRDEINCFFHSNKVIRKYLCVYDIFNMLEKKVLDKASCLMIPSMVINVVEMHIKIIRHEIENYFENEHFLYLEYQKDINRFIYCWDNLCWTQEGKINKIKISKKIIENSKLNTKMKYILACNNCLVDKIPDLLEKLPEFYIKFLFNSYFGEDYFIESSRVMQMFWTFYFKGDMELFYDHFKANFDYENLLDWAIGNENEVALQYIWENLVDRTVEHNLMKLIDRLNDSSKNNHLLYFFIQLNRPELEDLELIQRLAMTLYRVSWYYNIDFFSDYMLEISRTNNVCDTLKVFSFCWDESIRDDLNTFVNILKKIVLHFGNDIRNNFDDICSKFLECLLLNKDFQMIKILLRVGTPEQKFKVLSISFCVDLIYESVINFEEFIKDVFDSEEEVSRFKSMIFANPRFDEIYYKLLIDDKFKDLDKILIRFCPMHEINEFKNNLPHKNNESITLSICRRSNEDHPLMTLDKFIAWCCEDENKINICKERIFNIERICPTTASKEFFDKLNYLKEHNKWELLEQYWKWIFFATKNKIISAKEKLDRIEKILKFQIGKNTSKYLKRFITSCFTADEIDELKEALKTNDTLLTLAKYIIRSRRVPTYSKDLFEWIFSFNKEAKEIFLENLKLKMDIRNSITNENKKIKIN